MTTIILLSVAAKRAHERRRDRRLAQETTTTLKFETYCYDFNEEDDIYLAAYEDATKKKTKKNNININTNDNNRNYNTSDNITTININKRDNNMPPRSKALEVESSVIGSNSLHSIESASTTASSSTAAFTLASRDNISLPEQTEAETTPRRAFRFLGLGPKSQQPQRRSTAKDLVHSIQANNFEQVRFHLEHGADPNDILWLSSNDRGTAAAANTNTEGASAPGNASAAAGAAVFKLCAIDTIFLWKRLFGDSATPMHVAILNVYHRHGYRRRELERALAIMKLMLMHGADISTRFTNIFLFNNSNTKAAASINPMDLAKGLKRLTLCSMSSGGKPEAAMDAALAILGGHYQHEVAKGNDNSNRTSKGQRPNRNDSNNRIPFNMMSAEDVERMRKFLFTKHPADSPYPTIQSLEKEYSIGDDDVSFEDAEGEV